MSLQSTINDIQFEHSFHKTIRDVSKKSSTFKEYHNGVPHQMVLVFKTICCLPDRAIKTPVVKKYYELLFGDTLSSTSIIRNFKRLENIGLLDVVDNPHGGELSDKYTWINLTTSGRKLQKKYLGSTSDWKDKPNQQTSTLLRTEMSGGDV